MNDSPLAQEFGLRVNTRCLRFISVASAEVSNMAVVSITVVIRQGTAYSLKSMRLRALCVFQPQFRSRPWQERNSSNSFLGVYLGSISKWHQADLAGTDGTNRITPRSSINAASKAFR